MQPSMANEVSEALDAQPVLVCASDFGWVNRPRLWWTLVDWSSNPNEQKDDGPLQWTKQGKWQRLRKSVSDFELDGLSFSDVWGGVWTPDDTGRLLIPPLKVKEQLHDIPTDYTAVDGLGGSPS